MQVVSMLSKGIKIRIILAFKPFVTLRRQGGHKGITDTVLHSSFFCNILFIDIR